MYRVTFPIEGSVLTANSLGSALAFTFRYLTHDTSIVRWRVDTYDSERIIIAQLDALPGDEVTAIIEPIGDDDGLLR